jgi:hypothetical protein
LNKRKTAPVSGAVRFNRGDLCGLFYLLCNGHGSIIGKIIFKKKLNHYFLFNPLYHNYDVITKKSIHQYYLQKNTQKNHCAEAQ